MFETIYPSGESGFWVFLLVSVALGGATAWATGRAIALTWRPIVQLIGYIFLLTLAVRFFHYALFHEPFLPLGAVIIDFFVLITFALLGFRYTRSAQMVSQYPWIFRRNGPLNWQNHS